MQLFGGVWVELRSCKHGSLLGKNKHVKKTWVME